MMGYCGWADFNERNRKYHDEEWGVPVHDDKKMFEHLMLECMQCGLSWDLMLTKREIIRSCFDGFDYDKIASYGDADLQRILDTKDMIRSPRKIAAIINNAKCFQKVREEFGSFCNYMWSYSGNKVILYNGHNKIGGKIPVSNRLSKIISKDLKRRGFKYVGEVTIYSHLQACGIIILCAGIAAYIILLYGTRVLLHRQVTSELFLIVGWTMIEVASMNRSFAWGTVSLEKATIFLIITAIAAILSLFFYLQYYRVKPMTGYFLEWYHLLLKRLQWRYLNSS